MSKIARRRFESAVPLAPRIVTPLVLALAVVVAAFSLATRPLLAQSPPPTRSEFHLALAGDAIIVTPPEAREADPGFMAVVNAVRKGDAAIVQVEGTFGSREAFPVNKSGGTWIHFHPDRLKGLQWMGFNLFSAANNHSFDFGIRGVQDTVNVFRQGDAVFAGIGGNLGEAREPGYLTTSKGRVALVTRAASFLQLAPAGQARPDMHGRPGLAALRHETRYRVDAAAFASLGRMREDLKLGGAQGGSDSLLNFGGNTFERSDTPGVVTTPHPDDLKDYTDTIRDARQMANYVFTYIHAHDGAPGTNGEVAAQYVEAYARAAIDAGADIFAASGPHYLRGIEIYKGKLIFYSLGNFIFENDLVVPQPSDNYSLFDLGPEARPADLFNARSDFDRRTWPADPRMWKSVVANVVFRDGRPAEVTLTPVTLGFRQKRPDRGYPRLADPAMAAEILGDLQRLSKPYGTTIVIKNGIGTITIAEMTSETRQP